MIEILWTVGSLASMIGLVIAVVDLAILRHEEHEIRELEHDLEERRDVV